MEIVKDNNVNTIFFSPKNFNHLLYVIETDVKKRKNIDVHELCENTRDILFNSMSSSYDDPNVEKTLTTLNKNSLLISIPKIINPLSENKEQEYKTDLITESKTTSLSDLPIIQPSDMFTPINSLSLNPEIPDAHEETKHGETNNYQLTQEQKVQDEKNIRVSQMTLQNQVNEKKYIVKTVAIDINSRDRDQIQNSHQNIHQSAYDFSVTIGKGNGSGIGTQDILKNIVKITLSHIIIPNVNNNISRFPYLYLEIPEFKGQFLGTSDHSNKAFAKIIRDKDWAETSNSNISFFCMYDKFSKGWELETPLSTLQKISLQIKSPRGEIIKSQPDTISLDSIDFNTNMYVIKTENYFTTSQLNVDHIVTFHNINIVNQPLTNFLEQEDGHVITSIESDVPGGDMYNKFLISFSSNFDYVAGTKNFENHLISEVLFVQGVVLNSSLQTSASFHCDIKTFQNINFSDLV